MESALDIIPDLYIRPEFDLSEAAVSFTCPGGCSGAKWEVTDGEKVINSGTVPPSVNSIVSFSVDMKGFTPWSVHNPHLYTLVLYPVISGVEKKLVQKFGMSKIETKNNRIYFNNREIFLKGVIRGREAHDHPNLMNLSEREYYRKYILEAKA